MKKLSFVLLLVCLVTFLAGCAGNSTTSSTPPRQQSSSAPSTSPANPENNVTLGEIAFPLSQDYTEATDSVAIDFAFEPGVAWVRVLEMDQVGGAQTQDEQLSLLVSALVAGFEDSEELSVGDLTVAGVPAKKGQYRGSLLGEELEMESVVFYGPEKAYALILYLAAPVQDQYRDTFMSFVETVQLVDEASA